MLEDTAPLEIPLVVIELYDLNLVLGVLNEGTQRKPEIPLFLVAEVDCVQIEVCLVGVYLLLLSAFCASFRLPLQRLRLVHGLRVG